MSVMAVSWGAMTELPGHAMQIEAACTAEGGGGKYGYIYVHFTSRRPALPQLVA